MTYNYDNTGRMITGKPHRPTQKPIPMGDPHYGDAGWVRMKCRGCGWYEDVNVMVVDQGDHMFPLSCVLAPGASGYKDPAMPGWDYRQGPVV